MDRSGAAAAVAPLSPPVMVGAALGAAAARLRARGMATPHLDATVLLAHAFGVSKERLFAAYPEPLPEAVRRRFESLLIYSRSAEQEPHTVTGITMHYSPRKLRR